jgi:hypothetical protein
MKQILSIQNTLIVSDIEAVVLAHPTTVFTDDNVQVELFADELYTQGLNTDHVDSTLNQLADIEPVITVVSLGDSPRTTASDEAVSKLVAKNTIIITPEP